MKQKKSETRRQWKEDDEQYGKRARMREER